MWIMSTGIEHAKEFSIAMQQKSNALGLVVECKEAARTLATHLLPTYEASPFFQAQDYRRDTEKAHAISTDAMNLSITLLKNLRTISGNVLVTHITDIPQVIQIASIMHVKAVLLAGHVMPRGIMALRSYLPSIKIIKSLPVVDHSSIRTVKDYTHIVDAIELDTMDTTTGKIGGTGRVHDWSISRKIVQEYGRQVPIILAGGLCSDNIEKAIQMVRPMGVDVSTGVKNSQGILDAEKLEEFTNKARRLISEHARSASQA